MKKIIVFALTVLMSISVCSCGNNLEKKYTAPATTAFVDGTTGTYPAVTVKIDNTTPYDKLITKTVDIHKFIEKYCMENFYSKATIGQIFDEMGIECLRQNEDGENLRSSVYSVHKVKQGGLLYIFYDSNSTFSERSKAISWFYVQQSLSSQDFADIQSGSTIEDVIKIDPTAQLSQNMYNSSDYLKQEKASLGIHYLKDGILTIIYKYEDGKLKVDRHELNKEFIVYNQTAGRAVGQNGKILDIDRV